MKSVVLILALLQAKRAAAVGREVKRLDRRAIGDSMELGQRRRTAGRSKRVSTALLLMLLPMLSCSIFNEPNPEQIITCACDTTCDCESDCDCDPDCGADCSCDTTTTCQFKCDCDPECRQLDCACDCDEKSGECDDELCRCDGDCTP